MKRIALYVRVSTAEQAREGYSIGEQTERLTKYCEAHGWIITKIYTDGGYSGAKLERPALQELIRDVGRGRMDCVAVYKLDRLSRSQKNTLYLIEDVMLKNNIDFISMTENFDTSTPFGRAMIGILSVFAQLEREQIQERMSMGREGRAKLGLWHGGGYCPIGYDYVNGNLLVNELEAPIIQKIFDYYVSGMPIQQIINRLDGVSSKYGPYYRTTICQVLANRTYAGYVKHQDKYFKGQHTPLIEEEKWNVAHQMLQESAKTNLTHFNFKKHSSIITGLCYCGQCGRKMVTAYQYHGRNHDKSKGIIRRISCPDKNKTGCKSKRYLAEEIESAVINEIRKFQLDPECLEQSITNSSNDEDPIELYEKKIDDNNSKIGRLMDLYSLGNIDLGMVKEKIDKLMDENETLEKKINSAVNTQKTKIDVTEQIESMEFFLEKGDAESTRKILTTLIEKIILDGDDIKIHWTF